MRENAIYTVTPPDMMLPVDGPIITILSPRKEFVSEVEQLYETLFNTTSVTIYHPGGKITDSNSAWLLSMINFSDTTYIDLDQLNDIGLVLSMIDPERKVFIGEKKTNLIKLLNCSGEYTIMESIKDYADYCLTVAK